MLINWTWFGKKYWKKIVLLVFLATISTVSFLLLTKNGTAKIYSLLKPEPSQEPTKYIFYSLGKTGKNIYYLRFSLLL